MGFICSLCFVSEQKKNEGDNKKKGGDNDGGNKKKNETTSITVVLKVDMHCEGCASRIVKCVRSFQGLIFFSTFLKSHFDFTMYQKVPIFHIQNQNVVKILIPRNL